MSFQMRLWLRLWLNAAGPSGAALCEGTWTSLSPDQLRERRCKGGWLGPKQPLFTVLAGNASPGSGPGWFVTGRLAGATGNWLYLQFKRRYSVGVEDKAAAAVSVVLSPMAEDVQGGWAISQRRAGHA